MRYDYSIRHFLMLPNGHEYPFSASPVSSSFGAFARFSLCFWELFDHCRQLISVGL